MGVIISPPTAIKSDYEFDKFDCGRNSLNEWLKKRALKNETLNASRTYVVCDQNRVVGFYCLALGSIDHKDTPGKLRRNMPSPIPVMVLGRIAVDLDYQGLKIGKAMLKDAVSKTIVISQQAGLKGMLVHAIDDSAYYFYKAHGFMECPNNPKTLVLPVSNI